MKTPERMTMTTKEKKTVAEAQVLDDREAGKGYPPLPWPLHEGILLRGFASWSSSIRMIYNDCGDGDDDDDDLSDSDHGHHWSTSAAVESITLSLSLSLSLAV